MSAATLLQDNFDGYANQAAFLTAWPVVGTQPSAILSISQSVSGPNSVNVSNGAATATSQRNGRSFTESGTPSPLANVTFSFDFYDSDSAVAPYRQFANLQDGTAAGASGQLISIGLNNNLTIAAQGGNFYMARILGFNADAYFKLNDNPVLLRSTGWHNLSVSISDVNLRFFVDGSLAETVPQTGLTLRSYDVVRLGSGVSSTREAFFDNVSVAVVTVPEPSTLALGVTGLLFLAYKKRVLFLRSRS